MNTSNQINIYLFSDEATEFLKKNLSSITQLIIDNDDNDWVKTTFPKNYLQKKNFKIEDFNLKINPESKDKEIDFENSVKIYHALKNLPNYILCDERFWLWLEFEKFYNFSKTCMKIRRSTTISDHWYFKLGVRRGIMFGILSRMFYRVYLTVDENNVNDSYELTKWVIDNVERYRNATRSSFSSQKKLVRGMLRGEKKAVDEKGYEDTSIYPEISKFINKIGGVKLLDAISEEDIEELVYKEMLKYYNKNS